LQETHVTSSVSSASLRLRLFGHPVLSDAHGAPMGGGVAEPHRIALLALLALHPKRTVARAQLTRYLWPTHDAEQARQFLNQALFSINKALGDDAIFSSAKVVRLGARVSVDALEFQSALEAGRPEEAMRLYTAPLMDGFELDEAPEFQGWAAIQRDRFATALKTLRPVAEAAVELKEAAVEVKHDLAEPAADVAARPAKPKTGVRRKAAEPAADFVLSEPELQAHVEPTNGPNLRAGVPAEPDLMTNAVPSEPEPRAEVEWIEPEPPADSEAVSAQPPEDVASAAVEPQEDVIREEPPSAPVPDVAEKKLIVAKRRRRSIPLPPARHVLTALLLAVLVGGAYVAGARIVESRAKARSIAVLPIEFSGRDPADAALAARITEELGGMLQRSGLIVTPSATFARRRPPYDIRSIAETLGVRHVLQGVMRKDGARVEFRFQLVNAVDGVTRWEQTYRPKLADIPVLQDDVAATVAGEILGR
jgi:TolB-like protein